MAKPKSYDARCKNHGPLVSGFDEWAAANDACTRHVESHPECRYKAQAILRRTPPTELQVHYSEASRVAQNAVAAQEVISQSRFSSSATSSRIDPWGCARSDITQHRWAPATRERIHLQVDFQHIAFYAEWCLEEALKTIWKDYTPKRTTGDQKLQGLMRVSWWISAIASQRTDLAQFLFPVPDPDCERLTEAASVDDQDSVMVLEGIARRIFSKPGVDHDSLDHDPGYLVLAGVAWPLLVESQIARARDSSLPWIAADEIMQRQGPSEAEPESVTQGKRPAAERLSELQALLESGLITHDDHEQKKRDILNDL